MKREENSADANGTCGRAYRRSIHLKMRYRGPAFIRTSGNAQLWSLLKDLNQPFLKAKVSIFESMNHALLTYNSL
jgi:hypothetical protein